MSEDPLHVYREAGPDGYPPEWHRTIKHLVRERAGHRCVRCGHPYLVGEHGAGEWTPCDERCTHTGPARLWDYRRKDWEEITYEGHAPTPEPGSESWTAETGRIISELGETVRIEARWRILTVHHLDGDKLNCRWWNLAALCQRCHLEIQGRVRMHRRWTREHSDWFKPYVAGYYARRFLGEDLTRAEVEARLEELLALEDRQLSIEGLA